MTRSQKILRFIVPSLGVILWLTAFLGVVSKGAQMVNADGDLPLHLAVGNYILDAHQFPLQDVFSHTMSGQPYTPHEWLSEVLFAAVNHLLGLNGAILLSALVISFAFWVVYRLSRPHSSSFFSLLIALMLAILASATHWLARPHIFTFLLLALWLSVLESMRKGQPARAWLLPLLMLFWVNLHGGFMTGLVTWLLYGLGLLFDHIWFHNTDENPLPPKFWWYYLSGGLASILATLANPSGLGLWRTNFSFLSNSFLVNHTEEYLSPDFHNPDFWPFLILAILLVLVIGFNRKKVRGEWLIPGAAWLAMSFYSTRNIPLFAIVSAPMLVEGLDNLSNTFKGKSRPIAWLVKRDHNLYKLDTTVRGIIWPVMVATLVLIGFMLGINLDRTGAGNNFSPEKFPVQAVDWLEQHPQNGNVFNYYLWGGYLIYREWPDLPVFIDGKIDFYGEALTRDYLSVAYLDPDWQDILAKYNVDWVLFPADQPLANALGQEAGWTLLYSDPTSVIFQRIDPN